MKKVSQNSGAIFDISYICLLCKNIKDIIKSFFFHNYNIQVAFLWQQDYIHKSLNHLPLGITSLPPTIFILYADQAAPSSGI